LIKFSREFAHSLKGHSNYSHAYFPSYELLSSINNKLNSLSFAQTNLQEGNFAFENIRSEPILDYGLNLINEVSIEMQHVEEELHFIVKYDANKIDKELLHNFIQSYNLLMQNLALDLLEAKDDILIKDCNLLDDIEYQKIIYQWNATEAVYPQEKTLQELFEEQVERTPDNIALVYEDKQLNYRELNAKSNQLAHYIRRRCKIEPDDKIALLLSRSEYMLIAILAVLKVGAAYVPIGSEYPAERIQFIIDDVSPKLLLTDEVVRGQTSLNGLWDKVGIEVTSVNNKETLEKVSKEATNNVKSSCTSSNLAYVIYTSGTTGKPKGVMIEHKGVVNFAAAQAIEFNLKRDTEVRALLYANYVFDAHVWESFAFLFIGGSLYLTSEAMRKDLFALNAYINKHNIQYAFLPPSLLSKDFIPDFKLLAVGGEAPNLSILEHAYSKGIVVINGYGPSEITVASSAKQFEPGCSANNIGKPLNNYSCYVLDNNLVPVPIGAIGELYIGGDGVARGYLNRPELTQERFIANPFQSESDKKKGRNARIYKTGDLVRWLANGDIEYIGRNDSQVKLRGQRIELGEIERVIGLYQDIKQVVVLVKEVKGEVENKYLVAYYVASTEINEEDLSQYIASQLPSYMLPSVFMKLETLPLTVNGKLDRRALPEPDFTGSEDYVPPRTAIEKQLQEIWAKVLGLPNTAISIKADFFRLGGNSILAVKLITMINKFITNAITIKDIFAGKTIENLATIALMKTQGEFITKLYLNNVQKLKTIGANESLRNDKFEISNKFNIRDAYNKLTLTLNKKQELNFIEVFLTIIKRYLAQNKINDNFYLMVSENHLFKNKDITRNFSQERDIIIPIPLEQPQNILEAILFNKEIINFIRSNKLEIISNQKDFKSINSGVILCYNCQNTFANGSIVLSVNTDNAELLLESKTYIEKYNNLPTCFEEVYKEIINHLDYLFVISSDFANYKQYVIYNSAPSSLINKEYVFLLPPGDAGAEAYINTLVPHLKGKNLVIFNNYLKFINEHKASTELQRNLNYKRLAR
jgi:amino acid adenylation domain-containing protein